MPAPSAWVFALIFRRDGTSGEYILYPTVSRQLNSLSRQVATILCVGWTRCISTLMSGFSEPLDLCISLLSISPLSNTAKPCLWASSAATLLTRRMHSSTREPLAVPDAPEVTITTACVLFSPGLSIAARIELMSLLMPAICLSIILLLAIERSLSAGVLMWECQQVCRPNWTVRISGLLSSTAFFHGPLSLQRYSS